MGARVPVENRVRDYREVSQIMQIYIEHENAFYAYEITDPRAIAEGRVDLPVQFDPEKKVSVSAFYIPAVVYFEDAGWTKTADDKEARKVRSCEGCALRKDGNCEAVKKYGAAFCAGVIFRKIEPAAPSQETNHDAVNHPAHYTSHPSGVECITITEHHDFCIGNAIKYLWRQGLKTGASNIEDLEKAVWYIKREIERIKTEAKTK